jgi:hypothetical protein
MVIAGGCWRCGDMRDHGAAALQRFAEDFMPLILLFAISMTGRCSRRATWMQGYGYDFLALLHAIVVIFTLLPAVREVLPHFQRPAQLGVSFTDVAAAEDGEAPPLRREFAPQSRSTI